MGKKAAKENPECAIAKTVEGDLEKITAKVVIDAAKAGDPVAADVFDQYVHYLCVGLVSIINMIDPEMIVLGGGVAGAGEFLLNDAGIIGAAMLGK